jgi:hypothetical protein
MTNYFASPSIQGTTGDRGKTTRRKSTKTVRGDEGRWIADMKEELASRPAGWLVKYELTWEPRRWESGPRVQESTYGRFDTEAEAIAAAAKLPTGPETRTPAPALQSASTRTRVWVEMEAK